MNTTMKDRCARCAALGYKPQLEVLHGPAEGCVTDGVTCPKPEEHHEPEMTKGHRFEIRCADCGLRLDGPLDIWDDHGPCHGRLPDEKWTDWLDRVRAEGLSEDEIHKLMLQRHHLEV